MEKMLIQGITRNDNIACISLIDVEDKPGKAFEIFSLLAKFDINIDLIIQSIGREKHKDIRFSVDIEDIDKALMILKDNNDCLKVNEIKSHRDVSKVSIEGMGMSGDFSVATMVFEALVNANINIYMITASAIKLSILIDSINADRTVKVLCDLFHFVTE